MTTEWDHTYDLVIVGSGGGGLIAALTAKEAGLSPVVVEKQQFVGGSTAMSGGVIWVPDNPLMRADGIPDSADDGLEYLQSIAGDPDQASSLERRRAFIQAGPEMLTMMQRKGVKLTRCEGWSDYHDLEPGGHGRGRSVEGAPWDGKQLGEWYERIHPGLARGMGVAAKTNEVRFLPAWARSWKTFRVAMRVGLRTYLSRILGKDLFTNGMSLVGQLTKVLVDAGVPIWLNSPAEDLVVEDGRVVGVRVTQDGKEVLVRGTRGVLLAAGGFERNREMRRKYSEHTQPNDGSWTFGNLGNTGDMHLAAIKLGAKMDYMDEAIWSLTPHVSLGSNTLSIARFYPHAIFVNRHAQRFANEGESYLQLGKDMYANDAIPAWLIFDDQFRKSYAMTAGLKKLSKLPEILPGRMPKHWTDSGIVKKAATLHELADIIGLDAGELKRTVDRFNRGAVGGVDPDFRRGDSEYNKAWGDPANKPNPCLGTIAKGPYYATEIYPGDVGTVGGVVCDEFARALNDHDKPIPGLYATGNTSASFAGRTYPGAGASIVNTMAFGYIAAQHAVGTAPL